jgi:heat shock protein HtpX
VLKAAQARPADPRVREEKLLVYKVEELAIATGLPPPKVYVTPSKDINAFATGRNPQEAVVAVTRGALEQLDREELEGILAHELSHVKNYDIRLATVTIAMVAIIAIVAEIVFRVMFFGGIRGGRGGKEGGWIMLVLIVLAVLFVVLAPFLSRLAYLAMSRQREYLADAAGALASRNPEGLARALEKVQADVIDDPKGSRTVASLYLANPFKRQLKESLWATHPPLERRIARLRGMDVATYRRYREATS